MTEDHIEDSAHQLKRLELVHKALDAATERQLKLATFALAGNVGAIAASTLAIKDYREKDKPVPAQFADAIFWFGLGAVVSTLALGVVALASEIIAHVVSVRIARGPTRADTQTELFDKILGVNSIGLVLLTFICMFAFGAFCFFRGLYIGLSLIQ